MCACCMYACIKMCVLCVVCVVDDVCDVLCGNSLYLVVVVDLCAYRVLAVESVCVYMCVLCVVCVVCVICDVCCAAAHSLPCCRR